MLVQNMIDSKKTSVFFIALSQVAIMAVWFSASAIAPSLKQEFSLTDDQLSLLTSSVQAGFVIGSLMSAIMGLADRYDPRWLILISGGIASIANFAILFVTIDSFWMIVFRFLTGVCMAGVYPVGMKLAVSWVNKTGRYSDTGLLVAILVAALTLGSSAPHLFNAFGGIDWRFTIQVSSLAAILGSVLILLVQIGPNIKPAPPLNPKGALFKTQDKWARAQDYMGELGKIAKLAGLSEEKFEACMQDESVLDAVLKDRQEGMQKYKVDSTPTFFVNGDEKISGNIPLEDFEEVLDSYFE